MTMYFNLNKLVKENYCDVIRLSRTSLEFIYDDKSQVIIDWPKSYECFVSTYDEDLKNNENEWLLEEIIKDVRIKCYFTETGCVDLFKITLQIDHVDKYYIHTIIFIPTFKKDWELTLDDFSINEIK